MNLHELKIALGIVNNKTTNSQVTITTNTLTDNINEVLLYCYDNQPIVIDQALYVDSESTQSTIVIKGVSDFLKVPNLTVEAHFSIDANQEIQIFIKYLVLNDSPSANKWTFSQSFPQLPKVRDNSKPIQFNRLNQEITESLVVPINELTLFNSYFIVVSTPRQEPEFKVLMHWGINFVGKLRPEGFIGIIESIFNYKDQLTISGTIRKPLSTETPQQFAQQYPKSSEDFLFPWNIAKKLTKGLPGISLEVNLDIDYSVASTVDFKADKLYFYTPLDEDWMQYNTNPVFVPMEAYAGSMDIKGAGISVNMVSPIEFGVSEFQLIGFFKGVSLSNLSQLIGLTGASENPLESLPDGIKSLGNTLGNLQLMSASISVDYSNLENIKVSNAGFTVGMPDLNWVIWQGSGTTNHFEADSIACTFNIDYPFSSKKIDDIEERHVDVTVYGSLKIENIPFSLYASNRDGFSVFAQMENKQKIPLNTILKKYAPNIPAPSDLTINTFRLGVVSGKSYSMALLMAGQPNPWTIPLGPTDLLIQDVAMGLTYTKGEGTSGSVSGTLKLGDIVQFDVAYDLPGDIRMRSYIAKIELQQLVSILTNQKLELPDQFNLVFENNNILIQKQSNNYNFQLATDLENFGLLALQIQKVNTVWGVAFGLDMTHGIPSTLPGLSYLSSFENMFKMDKFMLVVSSFDAPSFNFPDTANFSNPNLGTKNIQLPAQASTLVAGLNVYGEWTIDTTNKNQKLLQNFLGTDPTLGITLQVSKVPSDNSRLFVSYNTKIQGHPLSCTFGGQIVSGELGLFLTGSMTIDIQSQPQTFDVIMLFVTNGAFLSATMKGRTAIDFEVFKLSNLALEIGVNFEGIPSLGVAGTIDISTFESSIAVFFDSTNPAKSLVAGAVSDLHLGDVLDAFTGNVIPSDIDKVLNTVAVTGTHSFSISGALSKDLDNLKLDSVAAECLSKGGLTIPTSQTQVLLVVNTPGAIWYLTDMTKMRHYAFVKSGNSITVSTEAQFYCAPQATNIGSIPFSQGFYINGAIEFLGFNASMTVDIDTNKGISVDAQMDPIVIGDKALFSITAANGSGGPKVSLSTYNNPAQPIKEFIPPHFYINGAIKILGISKHAFVSITTSGASFDIGGDIFPVLVKGDLNGTFNGITDLKVGGQLNVGIGDIDLGPLGTFKIETGAEADTDIYVNSSDIGADFEVKFSLAGESLSLGKIQLDIKTQTIEDLPKVLFNAVKAFLIDLFTDPKKWAEYAKKALDWTADKIEGVLKDTFKLGEEAIKGIVAGLSSICAMTQALGAL